MTAREHSEVLRLVFATFIETGERPLTTKFDREHRSQRDCIRDLIDAQDIVAESDRSTFAKPGLALLGRDMSETLLDRLDCVRADFSGYCEWA